MKKLIPILIALITVVMSPLLLSAQNNTLVFDGGDYLLRPMEFCQCIYYLFH